MNSSYYSFLLCAHPTHTDLYFNGLPIGVIRNGVFTLHELTMGDGTKRGLTLNNLADPCPFKTVAELKRAVKAFVSAIQIPKT